MNCPICNSDQTNTIEVRPGYHWVECANCDHEGYVDQTSEAFADTIDCAQALDMGTAWAQNLSRERGRRNGRR